MTTIESNTLEIDGYHKTKKQVCRKRTPCTMKVSDVENAFD